MTREDLLKSFLDDKLLIQKGYLTEEQIQKMKYSEKSSVKLIEVIKIAIECCLRGESESITAKTINQYLNK